MTDPDFSCRLAPMTPAFVQNFGGFVLRLVSGFGHFVGFCLEALGCAVRDVGHWQRWKRVLPQLFEVGTRSIPVVAITGAFIGMVFAIELFPQLKQFGQESRLGGVIGVSVVRHLGPVLAAVMLAGRVGGAFTAELGTMAVTEQIDALRVMGTSPVSYLVVPRLLACLIMVPILTVFSDLLGIMGGWFVTVYLHDLTNDDYWEFAKGFVSVWDINAGLVKSLFFAVAIALISCYKGFHSQKGAQGVGRATTDAFVTSFITIMALNFFLAKFTNDLNYILHGYDEKPFL